MAGALPKVTEYVKNLGKSVAYSATDYMKNVSPKASEFMDTNADLFKSIYHGVKDIKGTINTVDRSIKNSKVYEAANEGRKALFEDLKTGRFYNPDRMNAFDLKAGGFEDMIDDDWASMSFDDDFKDMDDFDDTDASDVQSKNVIKATVKSSDVLGKRLGAAIDESTKANVKVNVRTAMMLSDTIKGSTSAIVGHQQRIYESMTGGLVGIRQDMARLTGFFIKGPMENHLNNSTTFYDVTTKNLNEMNAMMKELLEMQRNMYKVAQTTRKDPYNDIVGSEGTPDLKEYAKNVTKNLKDALGPQFDMVFGKGMGDGNLLLSFVSSPLKFLPDMLVRTVIPSMVKNTIEVFDDSLGSLFTNFMAKFNKMANSDNMLLSAIGKIFGINITDKRSVDTSKYKKDAVPFDGITRKSIIEVIPGYLARIESALTHTNNDRIYDYERGKWTTIRDVEKNYKSSVDYYRTQPMDEMLDKFNEYIRELKKTNADQAEALSQSMKMIARKVYDDGGAFEPYRVQDRGGDDEQDPWDYYGVDEDDFKTIIKLIMPNKANKNDPNLRKAAMHLAERVFDARDSMARMHEKAENGYSPILQLFNNAFPDIKASNVGLSAYGSVNTVINSTVDKYNKNIFDYLRGMYAELIGIGERFYSIRTGRKNRTRVSQMVGDPLKNLESKLQAEKVASDNSNKKDTTTSINTGNDIDPENFFLDEERKKLEDEAKNKKDKDFFDDLIGAKTLSDKYKAFRAHFDKLAQKPAMAVAGLFDRADKRLFDLIFGKEDQTYKDKRGHDVNGILNYIIMRTEETFDKLNEWFRKQFNRFEDWFKKTKMYEYINKGKEWIKGKAKPVANALRRKFGWAKGTVGSALNNTYGEAFRRYEANYILNRFNSGDMSDEEYAVALAKYDGSADMAARGKFFTKRGLAIVSPGEMVIPATFDKAGQKRQLAKEKSYANRFGIKTKNFFAQGNAALDSETGMAQSVPVSTNNIIQFPTKDRSKVETTIRNVMREISPNSPDVIADSLIGGGVSLITGMIGGPLLGAAVGAAYGITKNSSTVQKWLFGENVVGEDGKTIQKGGLISKDTQDKIKKYLPGVKDFGIAGAVTGLFTPFGILGGAMIGGAIGFLKNNDKVQDYLFGKKDPKTGERADDGLISKKFAATLKKGAPRMAAGAIGGILLGPGGFLINAALGSALGLISSTQGFHDFIFGKEDKNGKKRGGVLPKALESLKKFGMDHILNPLKDFIKPMTQMVKNAIINVANGAKSFLNSIFERTIGRPLDDFIQHNLLEPLGKWTMRILKAPFTLAKGAIAAPMHMLGWVGNNIRGSQIKKGTASDMTAQERLDWRKTHKLRSAAGDKTRRLDQDLANIAKTGNVEEMKRQRDAIKMYLETSQELGKEGKRIMEDVGSKLAEFMDTTYPEDGNVSLYTIVGHKLYDELSKAIRDGDSNRAQIILVKMGSKVEKVCPSYWFSKDQQAIWNIISGPIEKMADLINKKKNQKKVQRDAFTELGFLTKHGIRDKKSMRNYLRNLNTEIGHQEGLSKEEKAEQAEENFNTTMLNRFAKTTELLEALNYNTERIWNADAKIPEFMKAKTDKQDIQEDQEAEDEERSVNRNLNKFLVGEKKEKGIKAFLQKQKDGIAGFMTKHSGGLSKFFNVIKWIFFGATGFAMAGHFSEFWKTTIGPFLKSTLGPIFLGKENEDGNLVGGLRGILIGDKDSDTGSLKGGLRGFLFGNKNDEGIYEGGLLGGIANKLTDFYNDHLKPKLEPFFDWMHDNVVEPFKKDGIPGIAKNILFKAGEWYWTGIDKAMDNIVKPMATLVTRTILNPELWKSLITGIADGIAIALGFKKEEKTGLMSKDTSSSSGYSISSKFNISEAVSSKIKITPIVDKKTGETLNATATTTDNKPLFVRELGNGEASFAFYEDGQYYDLETGVVIEDPSSYAPFTDEHYERYKNNPTIKTLGSLFVKGMGTNFLYGLAGLGKGGAKLIRTFGLAGAVKNATKVATGGLFSKIANTAKLAVKGTWNSTAGAGKGARGAGSAIRDFATKLVGGADDAAKAASQYVQNSSGRWIDKATGRFVSKSVAEAATAAASGADDVVKAGLLGKAKDGILKFLGKIGENPTVLGFFTTVGKILGFTVDDAMVKLGLKKFGEAFAKKATDGLVTSSLKSFVSFVGTIPVFTIAVAVGYFVSGYNDAHHIFGVTKDTEIPGMFKIVAGLINAIKNSLPGIGIVAAFIPTSVVVDLAIDYLFPVFHWDASSIQKLRDESEKKLQQYNAQNPDDQVNSIEEYDDKVNPGLFKQFTNWITGNNNKGTSTSSKTTVNNSGTTAKLPARYSNAALSGNRRNRIFSSRKPSGRGHIYQNAPGLANMPFGNSTIGEAGCGPVTATNMINRLSGNGMDINTAARFAERGGYIDSTGGTTTDYISDLLRSSGYSAKETMDRSSIASALRNGQSAVLLGKSGSNDISTPFGGSNHYINAYGMDGRGNVITEDPDLPNGMRKYPMSRLMKDTQVGIVTGKARGRRFSGRRRSGKEKTIQVSNLARATYQIIQQVEAGSRYDAVNPSDGKTFSIGKIQWNAGAGNAKPIIIKIMSALGNQNPGISSTVWTALQGDEIYKRHLTSTEASEIKKLLATDASKEVQDTEAILRIENYYIPTAKKLGITDAKAIVYFCDSYNIGPVSASNIVKNMSGSISLDNLHEATRQSQTFGQNSQYWSRKVKVYNMCKSLGSLGGSTTINTSDLVNMVQADEDSNQGFLAKLNSAVSVGLKTLYGDLFDQLFGDSAGSSTSYGGSNLINVLDPNSTPDPRQAQLVNKMASIKGQIKYGLGAIQDPDKGEASCASTVAWAYNKVLGFKPGGAAFAGSTSQAKDPNFTTIWTNDGSGNLPVDKLQPGDILYQNWKQTKNNGQMAHTEMYAGNGYDLSHGGDPKYGPVDKQLNSYRKQHTMMVRRYTPFVQAQQQSSNGSSATGRSRNGVKAMAKAGMRKVLNHSANDASMKYINDTIRTGTSRAYYSGAANTSNVSYDEFLMTIVNVLLTIANNTSSLDKILEILLKNGIKIDKNDIQSVSGSGRSAREQIRQIVDNANRAAGKARNAGTAVEKASELIGGESTAMIVQIMEALATK